MALSLYETSVSTYLQVLGAVDGFLEKGRAHAADNGLDLAAVVETRLHEDMLPFRFQVNSVVHHSRGTIDGIRAGLFTPPPDLGDVDYAGLQQLVRDAAAALQVVDPAEVNGWEGRAMTFKVGDFELPFTAENFVLTFSLPNFYFHATTTYDMLRMAGVPLGKMDFLGTMRVGA